MVEALGTTNPPRNRVGCTDRVQRLVNAFPLWVLVASAVALVHPAAFTWFRGPLIPWGLGIIMLGMGLTLRGEDFLNVLRAPRPILGGVILQFTIMPSLGFALARWFSLPPHLAAGLILVACCPGGTASNVVTFLARGNLALSVSMTSLSTLLAIGTTPWLTTFLVGNRVPVDPWGLLWSTIQVILLPIAAGLALRRGAPGVARSLLQWAPLVAVLLVTLIVASIIGSSRSEILDAGLRLLGAVAALHAAGFGLGYALATLGGGAPNDARTIAIEVGMQNSGLGVVLARQNFASPLVAIPCALSSLVHSLLGSALAGVWRRWPPAGHEPRGGTNSEPDRM